MTAKEIKYNADVKRAEAKAALNKMFGIPENFSSGMVDGIVDDIIVCAILEITALNKESIESA